MNMNIKRVFSVAVVLLSISVVGFFAYRSTGNNNVIYGEASTSTDESLAYRSISNNNAIDGETSASTSADESYAYGNTSNNNAIDGETSTPADERHIEYFSADWPYYESVDALLSRANLVIRGTVVDSRVGPINIMGSGGEDYMLHTISTVHVLDSYIGDVMVGDKIEVMIPGGETETEGLIVSGFSYTFTRENEYVMFLRTWDYGPALLLNPFHAVYIFDPGARSTCEALVSAYDRNRITLTYEDLESIAALGR